MSLPLRQNRRAETTGPPKDRATLEAIHERVWSTEELARAFILLGLSDSLLVVRRRVDDLTGVLTVQTGPPQFYYDFRPTGPREADRQVT